MYTSVESSYSLFLQSMYSMNLKNKVIRGYVPISPGAPPRALPVEFFVQDCLVVLDVPAFQHAVCGGVLVMV